MLGRRVGALVERALGPDDAVHGGYVDDDAAAAAMTQVSGVPHGIAHQQRGPVKEGDALRGREQGEQGNRRRGRSLLTDHGGQLLLLAAVHTIEVDVDDALPLVLVDLVGAHAPAADAGVVDGDVEAAEAGDGLGHAGPDLVGLADVEVQWQHLDVRAALAEGLDGGVEGVEVDVGQRQLRDAVLGEGEGRRVPDACWARSGPVRLALDATMARPVNRPTHRTRPR